MKRLLFLFSLISGVAMANGPIFRHKDTFTQQEFENAYQDIQRASSQINSSNATNVLTYGAKGDCSTDDTASIQAAANTGKAVYIPGVTNCYKITSPLTIITNGQRIFGDGAASKIVQYGTTNENSDVFESTAIINLTFENLWVVPSSPTISTYHGYGFNLVATSGTVIQNCIITGMVRGGIFIHGGINNRILNNTLREKYYGDFSLSNLMPTAIGLYGNVSNNVVAHNSIFNVGTGATAGTELSGDIARYNIFDSNDISSCTTYGILLYNTHVGTDTLESNIISNNSVSNITGNTPDASDGNFYYGTGIYIQGAEYTTITGNNVYNTNATTKTITDQLAPSGIGVTNAIAVTITGNRVQKSNGFAGILVRDPSLIGYTTGYATITGNTVVDARVGILGEDRHNVSIVGNTIDHVTGDVIQYHSNQHPEIYHRNINITGNSGFNSGGGVDVTSSSEVVIVANNMNTVSSYGVLFSSGAHALIANNLARGVTSGGGQPTGILVGVGVSSCAVYGNYLTENAYGLITNSSATLGQNQIFGNTIADYTGTFSAIPWTVQVQKTNTMQMDQTPALTIFVDATFKGNTNFTSTSSTATFSGPVVFNSPVTFTSTATSTGTTVSTSPINFTGIVTATNAANSLGGNGSLLTSLNASNIGSGTVPNANIDASSITKQANTFNGNTQLVQTTSGGLLPALSGVNLTALNASNIASGTVADGRLSSNVALLNSTQTFTGGNTFNSWTIHTGSMTATNASNTVGGNGSALTSLNASNLGSGTVPDARLDSSSVTLQANTFNGNSQLVQTTSGGLLPALSAANLTSIPAANVTGTLNISSGTITTFNSTTITASSVTVTNAASVGKVQVAESASSVQFQSLTSTGSGVRINTDDTVELLSRGQVGLRVNANPQAIAQTNGTACLPSFAWNTDGGSGMFLVASDVPGFSAGCSTAITLGTVNPSDDQSDTPVTFYGANSATTNVNSKTSFDFYTSSAVSTSAKVIAQLNQDACLIIVSGHDGTSTNGFVDLLLAAFDNSNPTVISQKTLYGAPAVRTYSAGTGGAMKLAMASGTYLIGTFSLEFAGR